MSGTLQLAAPILQKAWARLPCVALALDGTGRRAESTGHWGAMADTAGVERERWRLVSDPGYGMKRPTAALLSSILLCEQKSHPSKGIEGGKEEERGILVERLSCELRSRSHVLLVGLKPATLFSGHRPRPTR